MIWLGIIGLFIFWWLYEFVVSYDDVMTRIRKLENDDDVIFK